MCGIVGIYNPYGLPYDFKDKKLLKNMTLSLHNRGPDEKGVLYSETAYLGHSRLSIVDIETGQQPMYSKEYQIAVTFNGEIFNYIELREELKKKNYKFHTTCDTETLIYLYHEHGHDMLHKLNGQFAFAIVDFNKNRIFLARDRMGIRPLFYTFIKDTLLFSSCIKTILLHPLVAAVFNYKAYHQLINIWTTYGDVTFFKDIYSLTPGEYLEYSKNEMTKKIYWDLSFNEPENLSLDEWKEKIKNALSDATSLRLRADVPVNAYLSGGLDSSITLKLIQNMHKGNLESFSVGFKDQAYDETSYQQLMSDYTKIKNNSIMITSESIGDIFEDIVYHAEQPVYRTAPAPLYYLAKMVNDKGYKVVITGEGADEVAWGYDIFKETYIRYNMAKNPDNPKLLSEMSSLYPYLKQFDKKYRDMLTGFYKRSVIGIDPDSLLFSHTVRMSNGKNVLNFVSPDIKNELSGYNIEDDVIPSLPKDFSRWTILQKTQYLEMKTLLSGYLLSTQGDRMSMAHGVEGRYPFLDYNVVEMFAHVPDNFKLNYMNEKYILKEAFKDILPEAIISRNKYPYRAPEAVSLMTKKVLNQYLNEEVINRQNFFCWKYVSRLIDKLQKNINQNVEISFNDNFTYVNIVGTTMFLSFMDNKYQTFSYQDKQFDIKELEL
ncbi:MAG: asparagine synthase (glutamine-hydrolyzing) [Desulfobacterales bacterium]|nr:asparagine synthase (glutamine-hydrolyzing) [Desulfobacterales bacterium]